MVQLFCVTGIKADRLSFGRGRQANPQTMQVNIFAPSGAESVGRIMFSLISVDNIFYLSL